MWHDLGMRRRIREMGAEATTWPAYLAEIRSHRLDAKVVGIDLSLNSTGLFVGTRDLMSIEGVSVLLATPEGLVGQRRLDFVVDGVLGALEGLDVAVVCFEDAAFASPHRAHAKGELHGVVKREVWLRGYWCCGVPPASLKVFATGRGNGDKGDMKIGVFKRWKFEHPSADIVDAFGCSKMGAALIRPRGKVVTQAQLGSLAKVRLEPPRVVL